MGEKAQAYNSHLPPLPTDLFLVQLYCHNNINIKYNPHPANARPPTHPLYLSVVFAVPSQSYHPHLHSCKLGQSVSPTMDASPPTLDQSVSPTMDACTSTHSLYLSVALTVPDVKGLKLLAYLERKALHKQVCDISLHKNIIPQEAALIPSSRILGKKSTVQTGM